ncbi:hypothetical protein ACEUAI_20810 [Aeromonas veronii]
MKEGSNLGKPWAEEDNQFLRENHSSMTYQSMANKLGRTYDSVRAQCRFLGLRKMPKRVRPDLNAWTQEQDDFIELNRGDMTCEQMGDHINRTAEAVQQRCKLLGLKKRRDAIDKAKYEADEAFMKANYLTMTHQEIADVLGLNKEDVSRICTRRGFIKEELWTEEQDGLLLALRASGTKFKDIAPCFPTRTLTAIRQHHRKLLCAQKEKAKS